MAYHICILGIDGSGKSTLTDALPHLLAAETNLKTASAGAVFRVVTPEQDDLLPGFYPHGLPLILRVSGWFKKLAKRAVNNRRLYPGLKLLQMLLQDAAARKLEKQHAPDILISDCNFLLSTAGRAANYLCPASEGANRPARNIQPEDLRAAFDYVLNGVPLPGQTRAKLPGIVCFRVLHRFTRRLGIQGIWLPDHILFLDITPETAVSRIRSRGTRMDGHENPADLTQARDMYLKTLDAFARHRSPDAVHLIPADARSPGEVLRSVVRSIRPHLPSPPEVPARPTAPLGTAGEASAVWKKILTYRYLFRYILKKSTRGAWREPTFLISKLGRQFLKEGYSAAIMRAIYDRERTPHTLLDRIFLNYPLHRAVYDRLQTLIPELEHELATRLEQKPRIRIFTAPSGFAYDIFKPLKKIAARAPGQMDRITLVAADLDPAGCLAGELAAQAAQIGIHLEFRKHDITDDGVHQPLEGIAPCDLVLFIGLSSWLPKPRLLRHLRWVRRHLTEDGLFVSDVFTPAACALSGYYVGYKAHYYTPEIYGQLLDCCGFDSRSTRIRSGPGGINHVLFAPPGQTPETRRPEYRPEWTRQPRRPGEIFDIA